MKNRNLDIQKEVNTFRKSFKKRFAPKLLLFLFFLLLSTILWFLNALNSNYVTDISIPIRYRDYPAGKVLASNPPEELKLIVDDDGFSIIKYRFFSNNSPVVININSFSLNKLHENNSDQFYLLTNKIQEQIKDDLSRRFSRPLKIKDIQPDSIVFIFDKEIKKWVKIEPDIDIKFESQFNVRGNIISSPDSVQISGAAKYLDTIDHIKTEKQELYQINQTTTMEVKLNPISNISINEEVVRLTIPVDKFTESSQEIEIEIRNLPDSLYLRTFPKYVSLSFLVGLNDFDRIASPLFSVSVDYMDILNSLEEKPNVLKVNLEKYPTYIKSPVLKPKTVEYIIEKK